MRTLVATILTGLILACPFVCGAAEADHDSHRGHPSDGGPSSPAHCPDDGDDCICRGAVQPSDVRVLHSDSVGLSSWLPDLPSAHLHSPAHFLARLTSDGNPTGLAGWGDSLAVRSYLQNFRC